jgi:hypothetical protein
MNRHFLLASVVFVALPLAAVGTRAEEIAGLKPSVRPAGAPVITAVAKPDGWYGAALTGVSKPYPASLKFLVDQGNWFSPFLHAGMTGPYDIRGWHSSKAAEPAN